MAKLAIHGGSPVRSKDKKFPAYRIMGEEEKREVCRVIDSGVLSKYVGAWHPDFNGGPEVKAFEEEWAAFFGVKHAIAVNTATSALQCAIGALPISPGDEVIVTPYSMCISATAPLFYGAIPVFADVEPEYFCLDPKSVEARITPRTKAIIVVDLFGQPYDVDAINSIAKKHNLFVIEDASQSPGATYKGAYAGTLGHIGVYSLNSQKHIHTGEGGVIVTNDDTLADRMRLIRNHAEAVVGGMGVDNIANMVGYNFRFTEIQAAIGRVQLKKLPALLEERIKNCDYLAQELGKIPGLTAPRTREGAKHVYYLQAFLYDEKKVGVSRTVFLEAVKAELPLTELKESEGVKVGGGYVKPLYLLPLFQKKIAFGGFGFPFTIGDKVSSVSYEKGLCPVVEELHERTLFTHDFMRPPMTREDLDDVVETFKKVYENRHELK